MIYGESIVDGAEKDLLVKYLPDGGKFLEIGTWDGATVAYILDHRPNATAVSVDNYGGGEGNAMPTSENLCNFFLNAQERKGKMSLFLGTSELFSSLIGVGDFDLVFVDGDHGEEPAYRDIVRACAMSGLSRGTVAVHDVIKNPEGEVISHPGKALVRFLCDFPEYKVVESLNVTYIVQRAQK